MSIDIAKDREDLPEQTKTFLNELQILAMIAHSAVAELITFSIRKRAVVMRYYPTNLGSVLHLVMLDLMGLLLDLTALRRSYVLLELHMVCVIYTRRKLSIKTLDC